MSNNNSPKEIKWDKMTVTDTAINISTLFNKLDLERVKVHTVYNTGYNDDRIGVEAAPHVIVRGTPLELITWADTIMKVVIDHCRLDQATKAPEEAS